MADDGPPVDLARGDRVGGFRVRSILGWGVEGVSADVVDEFLGVRRVLKAYPAEGYWIGRLRHVAEVFGALSAIDICPAPIVGGVGSTDRGVPLAYFVVERRIGRSLEDMLRQRWSENRAIDMFESLLDRVSRVHNVGWALGDFAGGNNIVVINRRPLFIDIGFPEGAAARPTYGEDFECLADIARLLAQQSRSTKLIQTARSLVERSERRLDRRSLFTWRSRAPFA